MKSIRRTHIARRVIVTMREKLWWRQRLCRRCLRFHKWHMQRCCLWPIAFRPLHCCSWNRTHSCARFAVSCAHGCKRVEHYVNEYRPLQPYRIVTFNFDSLPSVRAGAAWAACAALPMSHKVHAPQRGHNTPSHSRNVYIYTGRFVCPCWGHIPRRYVRHVRLPSIFICSVCVRKAPLRAVFMATQSVDFLE